MYEYRNVPKIRKIQRAARVIRVAVGQQNGFRGQCAIQRFRRFPDLLRVTRHSCVHQCPGSFRWSYEVHIRNAGFETEDIESDFFDWHNNILGQLRVK